MRGAAVATRRVPLFSVRPLHPFRTTLTGQWGIVERQMGEGSNLKGELEPLLEEEREALDNVICSWERDNGERLTAVRPDLVVEVMG